MVLSKKDAVGSKVPSQQNTNTLAITHELGITRVSPPIVYTLRCEARGNIKPKQTKNHLIGQLLNDIHPRYLFVFSICKNLDMYYHQQTTRVWYICMASFKVLAITLSFGIISKWNIVVFMRHNVQNDQYIATHQPDVWRYVWRHNVTKYITSYFQDGVDDMAAWFAFSWAC